MSEESIITNNIGNIESLVDRSGVNFISTSPLKRNSSSSSKNPFISDFEMRSYGSDSSTNKNNKGNTPSFMIKSFREFLAAKDKADEERRQHHLKWLHFLRSDETSEPG